MLKQSEWRYALNAQHRPWLAYYDKDRQLRLRTPDGGDDPVPRKEGSGAPSGLALSALDDGAALLWRDKQPTKGLYLKITGPNESIREVGDNTEPLARFEMQRFGDRIDLLWYGERKVEESPPGTNYYLYTRRFDLSNSSLGPTERLMPGYYPVWSADPTGNLVVYSWNPQRDHHAIVARTRPASADTFGETVTIADVPEITPVFKAFYSSGRHFVVWAALYRHDASSERGLTTPVFEGAYSDDQGATWTRLGFDELRGVQIGSIDVAADQKGHIILALTVKAKGHKLDVWTIQSADNGATWRAPAAVRAEAIGSRFLAQAPSVVFGATPGAAVMVWEDRREIRARPYAARSTDYGKTWTPAQDPLPYTEGTNTGLTLGQPALYTDAKGYNLIAEEALDDSMKLKKLVNISFTSDDLLPKNAAPGTPPASPGAGKPNTATDAAAPTTPIAKRSEEALRGRVDAFWKAMVDGDYADAYGFYDPFFRARNSRKAFTNLTGKIDYSEFEVKDVSVDGPIAKVSVRFKASVPAFKMERTGETVSRPEQEITTTNNWLWIDDDWYREFRVESEDIRYTGY